jgi:hypothetical protein
MSKRNLKTARPDQSVLSRIVENGRSKISPTLAKQLLTLDFTQADRERMADLAERNQGGTLSAGEKAELMEYVDAGHVLSILHSLGHLAQKRPAKAGA